MARGLMPEGAAPGAAPPPGDASAGGAPPSPPGPNGQGRRATDEEKALYREFLGNIVNAIYEDETADAVGEIIRSSAQAPEGAAAGVAVEPLAHIVSGAVARVAYSGLAEGLPITREMGAAAAASMAADLGRNMAESVGAPPLPDDQIQAIYLRSMELLADQRDQGQAEAAEGGAPAPGGGAEAPAPAQAGNGLMTPRQQPNRRARRAAAAQQRGRQ